ncbi:MAG TPA: 23S rRNA (guanosine(2251)-2'-O)-methyltransferase RlmB [Terriglobales bacterium]|nr:23S rRNA (guanosine(2251)-2'-O)-methyltransferase RlmB [Terriglobales bacterium]
MEIIFGIHAVTEALKARGRAFEYVAVSGRNDARVEKLIAECRALQVPVRFLPRHQLDRMTHGGAHQGVVAVAAARRYDAPEAILAHRRGHHAFVLVLDGIEDPHNLGAILRTADAAGADGVLIPERRAVGVTATVAKVSAGASEHLPIARVTNLGRALEELKARNVWIVGLDERAPQSYESLDYNMDCALVLGAEGKGMHEQIRRRCDFLVSIPMLGKVPSLNVSVAAAVVMYELVRQRRLNQPEVSS